MPIFSVFLIIWLVQVIRNVKYCSSLVYYNQFEQYIRILLKNCHVKRQKTPFLPFLAHFRLAEYLKHYASGWKFRLRLVSSLKVTPCIQILNIWTFFLDHLNIYIRVAQEIFFVSNHAQTLGCGSMYRKTSSPKISA